MISTFASHNDKHILRNKNDYVHASSEMKIKIVVINY